MKSTTEWLRTLTALNPAVNKALGPGSGRFAPHKPLLLLCILELAEEGRLDPPYLRLSADLVLRFQAFWRIVVSRWTTRPDLRMPFHHLSNQGFEAAHRGYETFQASEYYRGCRAGSLIRAGDQGRGISAPHAGRSY